MRHVVAATFLSLDGVMQAPGGPQEDPQGGFSHGGWTFHYWDEAMGKVMDKALSDEFDLLLGRRTYDIFAGYWPNQTGGIAEVFNRVPKYVASRGLPTLDWEGSSQLGMDFAREAEALRERHESIHVIGSANLVQTLLMEQLFDVLTLWIYPVVLGQGKKVFPEGCAPANFTLLEPAVTGPSGAVLLRYGPVAGDVRTGDMTAED